MDKTRVFDLLVAAFAAPYVVPARGFGCGRAYVCLGKLDPKTASAVAAACKKLGKIFQRKAYYGLRNAIYVGYDNADGKALAQSEAIAASLTTAGLPAYSEACSD